ncbi:RBBP9/YdeN family alpha/beta hydrolase [Aggregatibacter kilianii]|uniref:RBBP9/YdeN family alpha/beta hydrolase n=1 Tax=Aggregatibacter kilianii TaxID=2025884 RepID=UPI000D656457|nr:alpha/beta fold hydrolase [Aggregatibacter kilianii]
MNRRQFCHLSIGLGLTSMLPNRGALAVNKHSKVFIIHGYGATLRDHWFPWLQQQLTESGVTAVSIPLPDSEHPDFERWQKTLRDYIGMPDEHCIFVAHSLGTISLLHYLTATAPKRVGGIILVAGFGARVPSLAQINEFNVDAYVDRTAIDFAAIRTMSRRIYCLISQNDPIVAPAASYFLAEQLHARIIEVKNGGHFLASDGFTALPPVWTAVEQCLT